MLQGGYASVHTAISYSFLSIATASFRILWVGQLASRSAEVLRQEPKKIKKGLHLRGRRLLTGAGVSCMR